jgi:uncharacterized protein (DUF433 family)
MLLEDYLEFLEPDTIRLKGHRIDLEHVLELYNEGYSVEQIALEFPHVSLEQLHAVIAYYWHNKEEVDAYLARLDEFIRESMEADSRKPPHPAMERIRKLYAERRDRQTV